LFNLFLLSQAPINTFFFFFIFSLSISLWSFDICAEQQLDGAELRRLRAEPEAAGVEREVGQLLLLLAS